MRLTFVNDFGQSYSIEVDPQMQLEDIMALLEAESGIPINEQSISVEGRDLNDPKATLASLRIGDNAMLLLRRKVTVAGRTEEQDSEMMRLQILGDSVLMGQLRETQPELAHAAANDPRRFAELLRDLNRRQQEAEIAKNREIDLLNADPFNIEAQKRIEEAIRQQAVLENLQHAIEYSPESFGRVHMLYIPVEVNSHPIKAFVDSGAQQTIMSPSCAEACGLMRLMDTRYSGIAYGVGTAKILGRIHLAQLKLGDIYLPCSFTIMEGRDVDLLFGLDMLKAHQACIDLEKNVLRIQGREVQFLPEHELPRRGPEAPSELQNPSGPSTSGPSTSSAQPPSQQQQQPQQPQPQHFPGSGHTLGSVSGSSQARQTPPTRPPASSEFPEDHIKMLINFGATREEAIELLRQVGGNVEVAASMLF
ncbi:DNA damage-inducible protein 1 [Tulasnella sp. 418]|nr:DNA damage-inducible protein 1 [Tulasnella sp. 418]